MAKTKVCPLCGKEYQDKFLGSEEAAILSIGKGLSSLSLDCCSECYNKYRDVAKEEGQRFNVKVANLKKATKSRIKNDDIGKMLLTYLAEKDTYAPYQGEPGETIGFCCVTQDGHFCMMEYDTTNVEYKAKHYKKAIDKISTYDKDHIFSAKDVSMIQYRQVDKVSSGLFSSIFTFDIRLNDEKVMTYKPCIGRVFLMGSGFRKGHSAEKKLKRELNVFQQLIGVNYPITKVKKFR